jgi:3-oxoacyl-[acyl-carrier-protein] synthase III
MDFGLASFGTALGIQEPLARVAGSYTNDIERVLSYGYRNVLRCPNNVGLTDLAVKAASKALAAAGIVARDLDLIVLAVTDITEYLYWDGAASVAHRLSASEAEAILINRGCVGGTTSLDTVAGKFATHSKYKNALIIAASRCCETYWNRLVTQPMVFSDAAVAVVAQRGHPRLRWRATETQTQGRYADFYRLDGGGTAAPFRAHETSEDTLRVHDAWSVLEFFGYDHLLFEEFVKELDARTAATVENACAQINIKIRDLSKVILVGDNIDNIKSMAECIGIPLSRTNIEIVLDYGHMGAADQFFGLAQYTTRGDLQSGEIVALVSRGRGMHWACTLLEALQDSLLVQ